MAGAAVRRLVASPLLLAAGFLAVHLLLGAIDLLDTRHDAIDGVTGVYRFWMDYWRDHHVLVGIDTPWVYPVAALLPMIAAFALGDGPYGLLWVLLVVVLDAVAFIPLARRAPVLAWWWLGFTLCLGPIAFVRLDAIALPIAVVGALLLARRPAVAGVLLTLAAWIKVWPAAVVLAAVVAGRRAAAMCAAAALTSAGVIAVGLALGARAPELFSFLSAQTGRGLQIEAPIAGPWLAAARAGGATVYFDDQILAYQVTGAGTATAASAMTPVLAVGVLSIVALGLLARRRGAEPAAVLALVALGLVTAFIALNKVGSPQYFTWLVAPALLAMLTMPGRFRFPGALLFALAGLTQAIYPWFYQRVLLLDPLWLAVLDLRNLLELVLLGWVLVALIRLPVMPRIRSSQQPGRPPLVGVSA